MTRVKGGEAWIAAPLSKQVASGAGYGFLARPACTAACTTVMRGDYRDRLYSLVAAVAKMKDVLLTASGWYGWVVF